MKQVQWEANMPLASQKNAWCCADGNPLAGDPVRPEDAREIPRSYGHGGDHAGARHRYEYRHFQRRDRRQKAGGEDEEFFCTFWAVLCSVYRRLGKSFVHITNPAGSKGIGPRWLRNELEAGSPGVLGPNSKNKEESPPCDKSSGF